MYWIYLIIFVLAILVPDIIPHDSTIFFLGEEQLEEIIIFILGLMGFLIFRWKERQSNINLTEKIKIQKEAHQISRSLTDTYSYIGETNRKLDVMKNISMKLLGLPDLDPKKEKQFFDTLMESIYILGKSKKFIIRFINIENGETEKEIKNKRRIFSKVDNKEIIKNLKKGKSFTENDYNFVISSPKDMEKTIAAIIISKNNQQQKLEDPDMLKALASQSLFTYAFLKKQTEIKTLIN
jgi:hypothetical protein